MAITSDDIIRLKRLPRAMTVVGGGRHRHRVRLDVRRARVEVTRGRAARPARSSSSTGEIVDELIHQMRKRNVTFRFGETVERFEVSDGPPRRGVLLLESGKRIVADVVLFSAGRIGATEPLNLDAAGLARRRARAADASTPSSAPRCRTSSPPAT